MIGEHDEREGYCRMLGHRLGFGYCRTVNGGMPCHKVLDCWFEQFSVREFIREHYTAEQVESFLAPPKPRMQSLLELIEQAKKRTE